MFKATIKLLKSENIWENIFNFIKEFKTKYNYIVNSIGSIKDDTYYFTLRNHYNKDYTFYLTINSQGFWLDIETDNDINDFKEKYDYIIQKV